MLPSAAVISRKTCSQAWSARKLSPIKGNIGNKIGNNMQCNAHKEVAVMPILSNMIIPRISINLPSLASSGPQNEILSQLI